MSELSQNPIMRDQVIINPERGPTPKDTTTESSSSEEGQPIYAQV